MYRCKFITMVKITNNKKSFRFKQIHSIKLTIKNLRLDEIDPKSKPRVDVGKGCKSCFFYSKGGEYML